MQQGLEDLGFSVLQGYGLTEATAGVASNTKERNRKGTVGHPLPGVEVRIANPDPRCVGELQVRGPTVMQGYFNAPESTWRAFSGGWLRTGDLAFLDGDGYIVITGIIKELIATASGRKIAPTKIESHYQNIDGVAEFVVVGVPCKFQRGDVRHELHVDVVKHKLDLSRTESISSDEKKFATEFVRLLNNDDWGFLSQ